MKKSIDNFLLEPNGYYLQVKEWHRKACPDSDCASALLSFLLFFHKHKQSMKEYARLTNEMLVKKGKPAMADESDWQYHTDEMLERKLFYWKNDTIRKAIAYLEQDLQFIDTNAPVYLKGLYKTGRTKWFRIIVPKVQQWILDNYPLIEAEAEEIVTLAPMERKYKKTNDYNKIAKRLFQFRQLLLGEELIDAPKSQLSKIIARLKDGKDEIELAHATIGNVFASAWHMGENPNSTPEHKITYHLIRHIYADFDKINYFTTLAENAGWTRAKVIAKYEEVLNINYENKTSLEDKKINQTAAEIMEESRMYRETASLLTELVITKKMKMDEILIQFYNHSEKLKFTLIDLSDPERLGEEIIECLAQSEIVQADRKEKIKSFARSFMSKLRGAEING